jgi:soluble lytic murein transglycosylase
MKRRGARWRLPSLACAACLLAARQSHGAGALVGVQALARATQLRHEALALGDSAHAPFSPDWPDTLWSRVLALSSPWQWEALSHLASRRLAVRNPAAADSLLAHASLAGWPIEDRASRLALAARARAALGDTDEALGICRQAMRAFPSAQGTRSALATFDTLLAASGQRAGSADGPLAAEVSFWAGERPAAIARLERAFASREAADRWRLGVRLAEMQRLSKQLTAASATLDRSLRLAPDSASRGRVWLERGRVERDAGTPKRAYLAFARAASLAPGTVTAESAEWELAREAEEQAEPLRAERAYLAVERMALRRAGDARIRRGLVLMNAGHSSRARNCFARASGEAARFWWAAAAAESSAAARDTALSSLAQVPGYSFYRVAARESLSLAGWPKGVRADPPLSSDQPPLPLIRGMLDAGQAADAAALLDRWAADDPRALAPADGVARHPLELLVASALEERAGRPREAVRLAQRASEALADSAAPMPWIGWPKVYPLPAASPGDRALAAIGAGLEPALLRSLIWKESHFDSSALSRTGAIGLMQLMPETAKLLARRLGDPPPTDSMLALPLVNVRYGAEYLSGLSRQFGGRVTLALAAYNAGTRAAARWSALYRHGGEAMQCELIAYSETQDYVKGILAARAAYRELDSLRAGLR